MISQLHELQRPIKHEVGDKRSCCHPNSHASAELDAISEADGALQGIRKIVKPLLHIGTSCPSASFKALNRSRCFHCAIQSCISRNRIQIVHKSTISPSQSLCRNVS